MLQEGRSKVLQLSSTRNSFKKIESMFWNWSNTLETDTEMIENDIHSSKHDCSDLRVKRHWGLKQAYCHFGYTGKIFAWLQKFLNSIWITIKVLNMH